MRLSYELVCRMLAVRREGRDEAVPEGLKDSQCIKKGMREIYFLSFSRDVDSFYLS